MSSGISSISSTSGAYGASPYADLSSALNDITDRWHAVANRYSVAAMEPDLMRQTDPQVKAVHDFLRGKVPEKGSNVVELVSKMTF